MEEIFSVVWRKKFKIDNNKTKIDYKLRRQAFLILKAIVPKFNHSEILSSHL